MLRLRKTCRRITRRLTRVDTRMLGGARRLPPTNWLNLACRAWEEVIRIHKRLEPFFEQQQRQREAREWKQEWEAALRKVYGPPGTDPPSDVQVPPTPVDPVQLRKDLRALEKTKALVAFLEAKLTRKR